MTLSNISEIKIEDNKKINDRRILKISKNSYKIKKRANNISLKSNTVLALII